MAKDVITRFKLETTAYDSKLQQAAKGLSDYTKTATQAKEGFNKFTQSNIEAARALGNISTTSSDAKNKTKELVTAFNEAARAYNKLSDEQKQSDFAKALSNSLTTLQQRIRETKQEMQSLNNNKGGSGGLFGGGKIDGMLQVFGGNVMTKIAGIGVNLANELGDAVKQGIELAKQGEGVRIAFERLGRGDILDGLREATHGTVTDLELMKAAVKFNDFRLPVEELGTMLAFAQQKAKDTGQSVDYMVDSIVTGLGRKSLMILDNLGLSAAEIKEEMKKTGDMTSAVGEIIRRQMKKAGDYVETAADRAAQANVAMQNKMEELGRKFGPVEEASNQLWTSMKIGILDVIGGPLATLLNQLTEAGRLKNALNDINGNGSETRSERRLRILREYSGSQKGLTKQDVYNRQIERYTKEEEREWRKVNQLKKQRETILDQLSKVDSKTDEKGVQASFLNQQANSILSKINEATNRAKAIQISRGEYEQGAKAILNPQKSTSTGGIDTNTKTKHTKAALTELQQNQKKINELTQQYVNLSAQGLQVDDKRLKAIQDEIKLLEERNGKLKLYEERAHGRLLPQDISLNTEGISKHGGLGLSQKPYDEKRKGVLSDDTMAKVAKIQEKQMNAYIKQARAMAKEQKALDKIAGKSQQFVGGLNAVAQGMKGMGIELPEGIDKVIAVISGVTSVIEGVSTIVSVFTTSALTANTIALEQLTAVMLATSVIPGFANGGLIGKAAGGMLIPGNSFSGDNLRMPVSSGGFIGVNSGEVILNKAQAGVIANELQGSGLHNLHLDTRITAEEIRFVLNNRGRRTGYGEYVQTNRRR